MLWLIRKIINIIFNMAVLSVLTFIPLCCMFDWFVINAYMNRNIQKRFVIDL